MCQKKTALATSGQLNLADLLYQKKYLRLELIRAAAYFRRFYRPCLKWLDHKFPLVLRFMQERG